MANLSDKQRAFFDYFKTNEGAYFFRLADRINKDDISQLFDSVEESATQCTPLVRIIRERVNLDIIEAKCSLFLFKERLIPDFLKDIPTKYSHEEVHVGYLVVIEITDYVVVFSRHANGQSEFKKKLFHIPGKELSGALLSMNSVFTQMRLGSLNMNPGALRNKSYESDNLSLSIPLFGAGRSVVKAARVNSEDGMVTISMSTSRISKIGSVKKSIVDLCQWAAFVIDGIEHPYDISKTLLGHFSTPIKWEEYAKVGLRPAYLLIDVHELITSMEREGKQIGYRTNPDEEYRDLSEAFRDKLYARMQEPITMHATDKPEKFLCQNTSGMLYLNANKRGMLTTGIKLLRDLYVYGEHESVRLCTYINSHKCFYVGFDKVEYIYFGSELHKDGDMAATMQSVLSIFEPVPDMNNAKSEKGKVDEHSTSFHKETIFSVVENHYISKGASHIVCDDLGNEWADHIVISPEKITFVHSKGDPTTGLSASNFQVVVAQAIKNVGNMHNIDIDKKVDGWKKKKYSTTNIDYFRHGDKDTFAETYKQAQIAPLVSREICLAVNFIRKKELQDACDQIVATGAHPKKNSAIQMIWLLNAFITSCKEAGLTCRILCKP